ncbi:hypothetical protein [Nostoc sp. PCC 9305]
MNSAVEESTQMINTLSTLLAARDVEQKQPYFVSKQSAIANQPIAS